MFLMLLGHVLWICPAGFQEEQPSGRKRSPEPQISTATALVMMMQSEVELLAGAKAGTGRSLTAQLKTELFQSFSKAFLSQRSRLEIHRIEHFSVFFRGRKYVSPKSISFSWIKIIKCNPPNRPMSGLILHSRCHTRSFSGSGLLPEHRPAGALP